MRRTFKYKAKINKQTESNSIIWLSLCCNLYNSVLEQRKNMYRQYSKSISGYDQIKQLPDLKKELPEFKQVGSQVLQDVVERCDKAFKAFFRRLKTGEKTGFPRFRSFHRYDSFTLKQHGWKFDGRNLYITNVGRFKLFLSRPIEGNIKTVTIIHSTTGEWFVSFSCDDVPEKILPKTGKEVGLDVGLTHFIVDSDSKYIESPKFFRKSEKKLRVAQRKLSRCKKGSNRRKKIKIQVAKKHEKVKNQRVDFLHKTANYYIENYDMIYIEDLKIKNMIRNRHLAKSIADASWGTLSSMLVYKAESAGRTISKVNPYKTSVNCSLCGMPVQKSLSVRIHNCPHCGLILDRDLNASLNIRAAGQAAQALTRSTRMYVV